MSSKQSKCNSHVRCFDVFTAFTAQVDINWSKQEIQPGEEATLSIKTSPKSLCSISTVDEATKFRSSDNFNVRTLVDRLRQSYRPYYYFYRDYTLNCPNVNTTQEVDGHYEWGPEVYSDKDTNTILDVRSRNQLYNF